MGEELKGRDIRKRAQARARQVDSGGYLRRITAKDDAADVGNLQQSRPNPDGNSRASERICRACGFAMDVAAFSPVILDPT